MINFGMIFLEYWLLQVFCYLEAVICVVLKLEQADFPCPEVRSMSLMTDVE
jgi:hypothetical protein